MNPFEELPHELKEEPFEYQRNTFVHMGEAVVAAGRRMVHLGSVLSDNSLDATKKMSTAFNHLLYMSTRIDN